MTKEPEYRTLLREERLQANDECRRTNSFVSTPQTPANWTKINSELVGLEVAVANSTLLAEFRRPLKPEGLLTVLTGPLQPGDMLSVDVPGKPYWRLANQTELERDASTYCQIRVMRDASFAKEQQRIQKTTEPKSSKEHITPKDYYFELSHGIWLPVLDRWVGNVVSSLPAQSTPGIKNLVNIQVRSPIKKAGGASEYRPLTYRDTLQPYDEAIACSDFEYGELAWKLIDLGWVGLQASGFTGHYFRRSVKADIGEGYSLLTAIAKEQEGDEFYDHFTDNWEAISPPFVGTIGDASILLARRPIVKPQPQIQPVLPNPGHGWRLLEHYEQVQYLDQINIQDGSWAQVVRYGTRVLAGEQKAAIRRFVDTPARFDNYSGGPLYPLENAEKLTRHDVVWYDNAWKPVAYNMQGHSEINYTQHFARLEDMAAGYAKGKGPEPAMCEAWLDGKWQPLEEELKVGEIKRISRRAYRYKLPVEEPDLSSLDNDIYERVPKDAVLEPDDQVKLDGVWRVLRAFETGTTMIGGLADDYGSYEIRRKKEPVEPVEPDEPDVRLPDGGVGWRFVKPGEVIQALDYVHNGKDWHNVFNQDVGNRLGVGMIVCRYVGRPQVAADMIHNDRKLTSLGKCNIIHKDDFVWLGAWYPVPALMVGRYSNEFEQSFARYMDEPKPEPVYPKDMALKACIEAGLLKQVPVVQQRQPSRLRPREEHIAEFWLSFANAVDRAGGSTRLCKPGMTAMQMADELAVNGVRIVYDPNTMNR